MNKRNVSVEFARLVASFVVILCHCNFFAVFAPENEALHRFTTCLLADSVGMFWLITGFYFAASKNYGKLWFSTLKKVMIPGILMVMFTYFFTDPIINGIGFSESEAMAPEAVKAFFISLITFRETSVYWYVFAYILVVTIQPLIKLVCDGLDKSRVAALSFIVISFSVLLFNDIHANGICHFGYSGIFVVVPAAIEVIWGHIIFRYREIMLKPFMAVPELLVFIVCLAVRTVWYSNATETGIGPHMSSWYTSLGFLMAVTTVLICMHIIKDEEHSFDDVIRFPAGFTYPIYLIHPFLLSFVRVRGFFKVMNEWLVVIFPTGAASVIAVVISFMVIYMVSFGIAVGLRKLCKVIHY